MQGYNKYYPPDYDGKKTLNQLAGKGHGLGNRASKIKEGILTVRFEAPFDIVCEGCDRNIAQGVRFNAAKKKVGMYFTTPIWSFRMKCASCSHSIEIRTDPKNTAYNVMEGARRRLVDQTTEVADKPVPVEDAFADIEQHRTSKSIKEARNQEIRDIYKSNEKQWQDPFTQSQKLRSKFRIEKKALNAKDDVRNKLSQKHSLHVDLVDEVDTDRTVASSIPYGADLEGEAKSLLEKRLYSSAFSASSDKLDRSHSQKALSNIAILVDKKSDVFTTPDFKRKKKKEVKPVTSLGLVEYSSDED